MATPSFIAGIEAAVTPMGGMALTNYAKRVGIIRRNGEWDEHLKVRVVEKLALTEHTED